MSNAAHLTISPDAMTWLVQPEPNPATLALAHRMRHVCTQRVTWDEFIAYAGRLCVPRPFNALRDGRVVSADWITAWRIVQLGDRLADGIANAISVTEDGRLDLSKPYASWPHEAAGHVLAAALAIARINGPQWTPAS